jgi:hypothetical protein
MSQRPEPRNTPRTDPLGVEPSPPLAPPRPPDPLTDPLPHQNSARPSSAVASDEAGDNDLLIFSLSMTQSAWFELPADIHDEPDWGHVADDGWRAAEHVAHPTVGEDTEAGLPRRVPKANLVPGSIEAPHRASERVVRDPDSIAAHTNGYFRGWRRGQQIGGFAVGQRDRAAWEFNRDQRARRG